MQQERVETTLRDFQKMFQRPTSLVQVFLAHQRVEKDVVTYAFRLAEELNRVDSNLPEPVRAACLVGGLQDEIKSYIYLQDSKVKDSWEGVLATAKTFENAQAATTQDSIRRGAAQSAMITTN